MCVSYFEVLNINLGYGTHELEHFNLLSTASGKQSREDEMGKSLQRFEFRSMIIFFNLVIEISSKSMLPSRILLYVPLHKEFQPNRNVKVPRDV